MRSHKNYFISIILVIALFLQYSHQSKNENKLNSIDYTDKMYKTNVNNSSIEDHTIEFSFASRDNKIEPIYSKGKNNNVNLVQNHIDTVSNVNTHHNNLANSPTISLCGVEEEAIDEYIESRMYQCIKAMFDKEISNAI